MSPEQARWIDVIFTRFIDHANEIVAFRVGVFQYRIQLPDFKRGGETRIPPANGKSMCLYAIRPHDWFLSRKAGS
jgi:hypothetical protein